jgi:hypothetical protein
VVGIGSTGVAVGVGELVGVAVITGVGTAVATRVGTTAVGVADEGVEVATTNVGVAPTGVGVTGMPVGVGSPVSRVGDGPTLGGGGTSVGTTVWNGIGVPVGKGSDDRVGSNITSGPGPGIRSDEDASTVAVATTVGSSVGDG